MVISVCLEIIIEEEIVNVVNCVIIIFEFEGLILMGFICKFDIFIFLGYYVFYLEFKVKNFDGIIKFDDSVMVKCCCVMEKLFNVMYKRFRIMYVSIGVLEIRVI